MKDIQDLLDELEDAAYNRETYKIQSARNSIDLWLEENSKHNKQLMNLKRAIVEDARKRKEKVIAIDAKTFKEVKGKEIKIKLTTMVIKDMEMDLKNKTLTNANKC